MGFFIPDKRFRRITEIDCEYLKQKDIKGLILDVDNTLSTHHSQMPLEGLNEWLDEMKKNGIKLIILSNSKKERVAPFANKLGLDFISLGLKPLPFGLIRAKRKLGLKAKNAAMVGDQIFTDIIGANSCGLNTILLEPIKLEDGKSFKIRRKLEKRFIAKYERKAANER